MESHQSVAFAAISSRVADPYLHMNWFLQLVVPTHPLPTYWFAGNEKQIARVHCFSTIGYFLHLLSLAKGAIQPDAGQVESAIERSLSLVHRAVVEILRKQHVQVDMETWIGVC